MITDNFGILSGWLSLLGLVGLVILFSGFMIGWDDAVLVSAFSIFLFGFLSYNSARLIEIEHVKKLGVVSVGALAIITLFAVIGAFSDIEIGTSLDLGLFFALLLLIVGLFVSLYAVYTKKHIQKKM